MVKMIMEERLQKILSRAGYGSRRSCEILIESGRVKVNEKIAILGSKADLEHDTITVDGTPLPKKEWEKVYIALHKPRGVLSDIDSDDPRPSVRNLIPLPGHLFSVGRLDFDSEGLILMTNDGDLANQLTHPRYGHEKEYQVLIARKPEPEQLAAWRRGIVLEDGSRTLPAEVYVEKSQGKGVWLRVVLREGKKRQIRVTGARIGIPVVKIIRVRIGTLQLGNLKPKEWRYLTPDEVKSLYQLKEKKKSSSSVGFRKKSGSNVERRDPVKKAKPRSSFRD